MVSLLRELVELESPSSDPAGVTAVATRLARELASLGLEPELVPVEGAGPILEARSPAAVGHKPVMLLGHLDTVWPLGTLARRPARVEGDLFEGPGAYDMKAGLVVAVFSMRLLLERGSLPPLLVFFTPLEEVSCAAYRERMLSAMRTCCAVLDFEPAWPGGAVKTARKGCGTFLLRVVGEAAHAGADLTKGANAILELARLALDLGRLAGSVPGASVNVGVIRGGIAPNVVPALAELELDVRYESLEDGRQLETALQALRPDDPRLDLEVEGGLHYPPLERTPQVLEVYATARDLAADIGLELEQVATGGASEASFAAALGLPTLDGLGADGDGAHAEHEHVRISSLPQRAALAAGLIERLARTR
jgi:glutamate carboxypeptidase